MNNMHFPLKKTLRLNKTETQENIFLININNKSKLVPFNVKENYAGNVKYSPADSKE